MTEHTKRPAATRVLMFQSGQKEALSTGFPFWLLPEGPPLLETVLPSPPVTAALPLQLYVCHAHTPDSAPGNSVPTILMKKEIQKQEKNKRLFLPQESAWLASGPKELGS